MLPIVIKCTAKTGNSSVIRHKCNENKSNEKLETIDRHLIKNNKLLQSELEDSRLILYVNFR